MTRADLVKRNVYTEEEVEARDKAENKLSEVSFSTQFVDNTEYEIITETTNR
jgi:hypothetical protein